MMQKNLKITETMANGYSSDSTRRGLSYEYRDDLVRMIFVFFPIFVHLMKVTPASEGLIQFFSSEFLYLHRILLLYEFTQKLRAWLVRSTSKMPKAACFPLAVDKIFQFDFALSLWISYNLCRDAWNSSRHVQCELISTHAIGTVWWS